LMPILNSFRPSLLAPDAVIASSMTLNVSLIVAYALK